MYETSDTLEEGGGTLAHSKLDEGSFPTIGYDMTDRFLQGRIKPFLDNITKKLEDVQEGNSEAETENETEE